jgi:ferredoxin
MKTRKELIQEKKVLEKSYQNLDREEKSMSSVIHCQARRDEIFREKKEIKYKLFEITEELAQKEVKEEK